MNKLVAYSLAIMAGLYLILPLTLIVVTDMFYIAVTIFERIDLKRANRDTKK